MKHWRDILGVETETDLVPPIPPFPPKPPHEVSSGGNGGIGGRSSENSESANAGVEGPDWTAFAERAAILEHDGCIPRAEAEDMAARDAGFNDAVALRAALVASWRHHLVAMQKPELHPSGCDYVEAAIAFIDAGWAARALELGWSESELVGADEVAPWARLDRLGAGYLMPNATTVTATEITHNVRAGAPLVLRRSIRRDGTLPWVSALEVPNDVGGD